MTEVGQNKENQRATDAQMQSAVQGRIEQAREKSLFAYALSKSAFIEMNRCPPGVCICPLIYL